MSLYLFHSKFGFISHNILIRHSYYNFLKETTFKINQAVREIRRKYVKICLIYLYKHINVWSWL